MYVFKNWGIWPLAGSTNLITAFPQEPRLRISGWREIPAVGKFIGSRRGPKSEIPVTPIEWHNMLSTKPTMLIYIGWYIYRWGFQNIFLIMFSLCPKIWGNLGPRPIIQPAPTEPCPASACAASSAAASDAQLSCSISGFLVYPHSWMVYFMENPNKTWMMTGGYMDWKPLDGQRSIYLDCIEWK